MQRIAIYPGSFDPVTNGHLDIIKRGLKLFDRIIVAIMNNPAKESLFTVEERKEMLEISLKSFSNIEIDTFNGLTVDYAASKEAHAILRGMRAVSDFEYEFQLALMNRKLNERVETIFMMPKDTYTFLSSRVVKEITRLGGDVSVFVPPHVGQALRRRLCPEAAEAGE